MGDEIPITETGDDPRGLGLDRLARIEAQEPAPCAVASLPGLEDTRLEHLESSRLEEVP